MDEDSRSILSAAQSVCDHADRLRELAERLGPPDEEVEALTIAAPLHDHGKAAERWQDAMNAPRDDHPYTKTRGDGNWHLPEGYPHEFGSLLKAQCEDLPDGTRDPILHLIAAHHGYARPLISSARCQDAPPCLLDSKAGDAALRKTRIFCSVVDLFAFILWFLSSGPDYLSTYTGLGSPTSHVANLS